MNTAQFDEEERAQATALLEALPWGDLEQAIYGLEVTLALALEATGDAIQQWEDEGEERFGDEFSLSAEQIASLDDDWRLAYIARLLHTAAHSYGVSPHASPGRSSDGHVTSPISWNDHMTPSRDFCAG
jgi:hypothetical protein